MKASAWLLGALLSTATMCTSASATSIQIYNAFNFRTVLSANDSGFLEGDIIDVGVAATPNARTGSPDTTAVASQADGFQLALPFISDAYGGTVNDFASAIPFDATRAAQPWTITVTNPTTNNNPVQVTTGPIEATGPLKFVSNMSMTGSGLTPTLHWQLPSTQNADQVRIQLQDLDGAPLPGTDFHPVMFSQTLGGGATQYEIPDNVLSLGHRYAVAIHVEETRDAGSQLDNKSVSFFDFKATSGVQNNPVYLPTVDPTASSGGGPVYSFNLDVSSGQPVFIDPAVAVGYDFAIGAGDPLFASVKLPNVGDGLYDLYLFDSAHDPVDTHLQLHAGVQYLASDLVAFASSLGYDLPSLLGYDPTNGIDAFRILGIEPSAGLDPNDASAFVTQLTFAGDGTFTGTMTPIVAPTPLPAALPLFVSSLGGFGLISWRRRKRGVRRSKAESATTDRIGAK